MSKASEEFLSYLKELKGQLNNSAMGSASSYNWGRSYLIDDIYKEAKKILKNNK